MHGTVRTKTLNIAYLESGPADAPPVILLHGWPSDVHDWDGVVPLLTARGFRTLVPWLRGFGPTSFLAPSTPRSGQQAALGADLRDFMDALGVTAATLVGYDWGGRAACVVSALWPERVIGLVSITGYNIQNIATANHPATAEQERRYWYQWYLHTAARRRRTHAGSSRDRPAALAPLVAELGIHRSDVRRHGFELRQSRLCARFRSILSSQVWASRG